VAQDFANGVRLLKQAAVQGHPSRSMISASSTTAQAYHASHRTV
jgi:hypothetical protein